MTEALSIYAHQTARPADQLARPTLSSRRTTTPAPRAPLEDAAAPSRLQLVRSCEEPASPPPAAPRGVSDLAPAQEAALLASLRAAAHPGETLHGLFQRIELEVAQLLAGLAVPQARALHQRLTRAAGGDALVAAFHRLVAERRARLLAFLADARRREALARAR